MITRRHLSLATAASMTAGAGRRALAQGAPALRSSEANEITVAVPALNQFRAHQQRLQAFTALTGIRVRMVFLPPDQLRERVMSGIVLGSGAGTDVAYISDLWMPLLADKLLPLDDRLAREGIEFTRYPQVYRAAVQSDGAIRGLPIRGFSQLLFYRQDLFKRERLAAPATWEDVLEAARKMQREQSIGGVAMYYGRSPNAAGVALWLNFLWGRGGELFDVNWMPRFSDSAGQQATQVYLDVMFRFELAVSGSAKFKEADAVASLAQGRAAILPAWGWHIASVVPPKSRLKPSQLGVAPMPGYRNRVPAPCAVVGMLSIPERSANRAAAWEYLKWVSSAALETSIVDDRSNPDQFEEMVVHSTSLAAASLNQASNGYHAATAATLAHARLLPRLVQWPQVAEILEGMLAEAALGQRLLRSELEEGARQVEQLLRRSGVIKG